METRKLGWTDLRLSKVGLGTWAIGGAGWQYGWGPQDDRDSATAIARALELGINWIDTAAVYGLGHAEEVVGKVIASTAARPIVATKCGLVWNHNGRVSGRLKRDSLRAEVEASLRRLRLETIDLYQVHWPMPDRDIEEAWDTLGDLIREGKIRYAGVSNFTMKHLERIQRLHPVASLQPPYSMLEPSVEGGLLEYCAAHDIGVIVYSPLQKGLLTGAFTEERIAKLATDDHRRWDPDFQSPRVQVIMRLVDELRAFAQSRDRTVAQLAIAWVLRSTTVTAAIVGGRRRSQIEETAKAADWVLSEHEIQAVDQLLESYGAVREER
jgi:aryl-alcohol dehydrogenase-like predicted oxidoreductase